MIYVIAEGGLELTKTITKRTITIPELPTLTKVAAYARVSSGKDEMLHSLAAQVSYYSSYIQQHPGWFYAGVYADEAMTGTTDNRPEFKRLIDDCRNGKIDQVLTKSISRFARNTVDLLEAIRELKRMGVDVYFEEKNIHTLSGDGELMLTILASYAQEESRSVSENCKWRIRSQFENGELATLRFMFGYSVLKGKIEIDPDEAAIVRMIFEDYINGLSGGKIARKLKAMNVQTPFGGQWRHNGVLGIIKNEKYTGHALLQKRYVEDHLTKKLVQNNGKLQKYYARDTHPAIIDQETFAKAQEILSERRDASKNKNGSRNRYPFSGMIRCGICGSKYKRKDQKGKVAWYCTTYLEQGKSSCPSKQIPEPTLYSICNEVLGLLDFNPAVFKKNVIEIVVPEPGKVIFTLKDGHQISKEWKHASRRDSWSDNMRKAARGLANGGEPNGIC